MKKRHIVLAALAVVLVLCSTIGTSLAYFTTYTTARGGYIIKSSPDIDEKFVNKQKDIVIKNAAGASPIFVRVKVFSGSDFKLTYSPGAGWVEKEDDYWYYSEPLLGGDETSSLIAAIEAPERLEDSDEFNVVVIYESVLAVYDENGNPNENDSWNYASIKRVEDA